MNKFMFSKNGFMNEWMFSEVCFGGKFQLSSSRSHHVCKQRIRRSGYYKRYTQTSLHATKQNTIMNTSLQEHDETMQAKCQSREHSWRLGAEISKFMKEQYVAILGILSEYLREHDWWFSWQYVICSRWVWQRWLHILMSCTYNDLWISKSNECKHSAFPWRSESKADENQDAWSTAQHSERRGQIKSPLSVSGLFTLPITTHWRGSHVLVQQTTHTWLTELQN